MDERLKIGIIGDFSPDLPTHMATNAAIQHSADQLSKPVDIVWLATDSLLGLDSQLMLRECDGLWASPSSPYQSKEGALRAIRFAREENRPFIGT